MASTKHIYLTTQAESDLDALVARWKLSRSATIARRPQELTTNY